PFLLFIFDIPLYCRFNNGVCSDEFNTGGCSSVVERDLAKVEVEGSNPFTRSILKMIILGKSGDACRRSASYNSCPPPQFFRTTIRRQGQSTKIPLTTASDPAVFVTRTFTCPLTVQRNQTPSPKLL